MKRKKLNLIPLLKKPFDSSFNAKIQEYIDVHGRKIFNNPEFFQRAETILAAHYSLHGAQIQAAQTDFLNIFLKNFSEYYSLSDSTINRILLRSKGEVQTLELLSLSRPDIVIEQVIKFIPSLCLSTLEINSLMALVLKCLHFVTDVQKNFLLTFIANFLTFCGNDDPILVVVLKILIKLTQGDPKQILDLQIFHKILAIAHNSELAIALLAITILINVYTLPNDLTNSFRYSTVTKCIDMLYTTSDCQKITRLLILLSNIISESEESIYFLRDNSYLISLFSLIKNYQDPNTMYEACYFLLSLVQNTENIDLFNSFFESYHKILEHVFIFCEVNDIKQEIIVNLMQRIPKTEHHLLSPLIDLISMTNISILTYLRENLVCVDSLSLNRL